MGSWLLIHDHPRIMDAFPSSWHTLFIDDIKLHCEMSQDEKRGFQLDIEVFALRTNFTSQKIFHVENQKDFRIVSDKIVSNVCNGTFN